MRDTLHSRRLLVSGGVIAALLAGRDRVRSLT